MTLLILIVSCNEAERKNAENTVKKYAGFVDSVDVLEVKTASKNWDAIQGKNDHHKINAEIALNKVTDKGNIEKKLNRAILKFERFKGKVMLEKEKSKIERMKRKLGKVLLGDLYTYNDVQLLWITRKNVLRVYQKFIAKINQDQDTFTEEDWEEIKALYEALEKRRDEIEKEGLSGIESREIVLLKLKYAPIFTVNNK